MSADQANLTLRQRKRLQQSEAGGAAPAPRSKRRHLRTLLAIGLILLLGVGGAWAWMYFHRGNDPRYQEVLALQAKVDKLENPASPEAFDLYKQMHEKMKDLPDDLKKQAQENGMNAMRARFNRFFSSSSKDQLAVLDMFILAMQAKQLKDSLTGQSANSGADSGKAGNDSDKTNSGSGSGPGGHGHPWGGNDTQRTEFRQKMLSNLSPQQRAQWGLGRQMFNARMQQQGATPPSGGIF